MSGDNQAVDLSLYIYNFFMTEISNTDTDSTDFKLESVSVTQIIYAEFSGKTIKSVKSDMLKQ